ncbi:MAG: succinyl-diaminopimelate desuccinylase [Wenzhouxiangellaceae bacterium]|nr:succinyl-diaminopimelate desuccinylase [Wenzhouxiangellaceae bacterium]
MADAALTQPVVELARTLIRRRSLTPDDAGCQPLVADRLAAARFAVEDFRFGEVDNLLAVHGSGRPHLMLLGHTDVVPPGPEAEWSQPPFAAAVVDGRLYGRGAADMKSSVAAFVVALERFVAGHADHPGTLSLLLTSDEEGLAADGVRRIVGLLRERGQLPDHVLVGEPSSDERLGDVIRVGRRGSIQGRLTVRGKQGHTAYARPADNPVHRVAPALSALAGLEFDDGDAAFPATTLQVSNVRAGTGADNVTPGEIEILFNLRHNPNSNAETLERRIRNVLAGHGLTDRSGNGLPDWSLEWRISGAPFGPAGGALRRAVEHAVAQRLGLEVRADTGGGTSDGRFLGPLGIEVVELGPVNRTIHRIDEHIDLDDLVRLPDLYLDVVGRVLD